MRTVTVSTELSIPAERACELAQRTAVFRHVVWPLFTVRDREVPTLIEEGRPFAVRLFFLEDSSQGTATRSPSSSAGRP